MADFTPVIIPDAGTERDLIVASRIVTDNADFLSLPGGLTVRLEASAANPFSYNVAGILFTVQTTIDLVVTNNAHNFISIDDQQILRTHALPCVYSFRAPAGVLDQHWYDLGVRQMKRFDGAQFVAVRRIFIAYIRADGAAINARYVCEPVGLSPYERFRMYGDGSAGFLDVNGGGTVNDGVPRQYTAVILRGNAARSSGPINTFDHINWRVQSFVLLLDTASLTSVSNGANRGSGAAGVGAPGGQGQAGGGGGGGGGGTPNAGGAGGAQSADIPARVFTATTGAAAGGAGAAGAAGSAPTEYGWQDITGAGMMGSGGGGGGGDGAVAGGNGGHAASMVRVMAAAIALGAGTSIVANGDNGTNAPAVNTGGGGGGGGGIVALGYRNLFNAGTLSANGGTGGTSAGAGSGAGGAGGAGMVVSQRL